MTDFQKEIASLKVNVTNKTVSLHKPLLLLLTISKVISGHKNEFLYDEIEEKLKHLLIYYGLKNTAKVNPQYPFIYLAGNPTLWHCSINKRDLKIPDSASRKELLGQTGSFSNEFYNYLKINDNAIDCISQILHQYWPEAYHEELLKELGIYEIKQNLVPSKIERSREFVLNVLDAYERKCAICHQSIRLADTLIGIDACHVKPIQHFGDDDISNGIALCKMHHWALDRGAITISEYMNLKLSDKLNGLRLDDYFTTYDNRPIFVPRKSENYLNLENIAYHNKYIFVK
jgi:putative restriction endonuclease